VRAISSTDDAPAVRPSARHRTRKAGRGWFSKRWIYWKRRFSNPTLRDWVMLVELVCLVAAVVAATVSFRLSGTLLALVCAAAGTLRLLPDPWWATVRNRGRGFDASLLFGAALAVGLLTWSVPG
jgi:hypothetical protein